MTNLTMNRQEYDAAQEYSIANRRLVTVLFKQGRREQAYTQHTTDTLANPISFEKFCELFPLHFAD
jgi:hypothetical protein